MFLGPKTSYKEANTQKDAKTEKMGPESTLMRLGYGLCYTHIRLEHEVCIPGTD